MPPGAPASSPAAAQPFGASPKGIVLDGRYLLEGRIATGGMGEVWRGLDRTLGRPVAVKLLRPEYASDELFLVRFRGEARHAARVSHPGVASVYDYGEVVTDGDRPTAYLVMELVEGEPLSALLHREKRLSPEKTLDVLGQAADALQAAHTLGVVHRDVKPGNLLLRTDGAIKVTDFGIARAVDAAPLTATGIMMGTAYYVSPEQASGRTVTPASDVYSLGVVAYECLAGRRPFDDRNPIVVVMAHQQDDPPPLPPDVPEPVRNLVQAAMAKDPAQRPSSAGSFARTAATIRRNLWNADMTRRAGGPAPAPRPDPAGDSTGRWPGPTGAPGPGTGGAGTDGDRPPSWTRRHTRDDSFPEDNRPYRDARPSWDAGAAHDGRQPGQEPPGTSAGTPPGAWDTPPRPPTSGGGYPADGYPPPGHREAGYAGASSGAGYDTGYETGYEAGGYDASYNTGYDTASRPDIRPTNVARLQPPGNRPTSALPPSDARGARRRRPRGRAAGGPASAGRRRLSLPVLIALLIAAVAITALVTRSIAGSSGSSEGAPALTRAVHGPGSEDGIVTGDSTTGTDGVTDGIRTTGGLGGHTAATGPDVREASAGTGPGSGKASTGGSRD
ncbi:serine/threonine protein kinase [Candidatus Protofrankia datiscae]|uniref:non-specific serine/threonine protein kinase n=2 Tax=Protofrankia TaxID=2994361 RepID=F8B2N0_9ACTN|nr:serine/threonine-protein kinase [Candidatus Protofrankia datiscae]AEH07750.1 serine/threonine protein kinase [Candidatus Protofrankia datiscae]